MVSYEGINNAHPAKWSAAADDWHDLAKYALSTAKDLREYGVKPLKDNWTDEVGAIAAAGFERLANQLEAAYGILLAVDMVADGMTTTIETAHSTMHAALDLANRYGLEIGADGTTTGPPPRSRMEAEETGPYRTEVQDLIDQAVEQVTTADALAAAEFAKLADQTGVTDPAKALNDLQTHASHVQMQMLAADIPVGEDPATVRQW